MFKANLISDPASYLNKAAVDEPLFVLRANDPHAAPLIRQWMEHARANDTHSPEKIASAYEVANAMQNWRAAQTPMSAEDEQALREDAEAGRSGPKRRQIASAAGQSAPTVGLPPIDPTVM